MVWTGYYFHYNSKHYKQLYGTAMRSPVSVVVAEIVMQNIEESVLSTCRHTIYTTLVATLTTQTFHAY